MGRFAWLSGGLIIGVLAGLAIDQLASIEYKSEIHLSDLISSTITLLVAFLIGYLLQRRWDTDRWEKEKLIGMIEDLYEQAESVRKVIQEYSADRKTRPEVNAAFRDLSLAVHVVEKRLKVFEVDTDLRDEMESVKSKLYRYREFVSEDVYHEPSVVGSRQEREEFDSFADSLFTLVRALNRL